MGRGESSGDAAGDGWTEVLNAAELCTDKRGDHRLRVTCVSPQQGLGANDTKAKAKGLDQPSWQSAHAPSSPARVCEPLPRGARGLSSCPRPHTAFPLWPSGPCGHMEGPLWLRLSPGGVGCVCGRFAFLASVSSIAQSCPTLCDPMDCSMPGFPVLHQLPEFAQTHVH